MARYESAGSCEGGLFNANINNLGLAFEKDVKGRLYPVVGFTREPVTTVANFGEDVAKKPFVWELGNSGRYEVDSVKAKESFEGKRRKKVEVDVGPLSGSEL